MYEELQRTLRNEIESRFKMFSVGHHAIAYEKVSLPPLDDGEAITTEKIYYDTVGVVSDGSMLDAANKFRAKVDELIGDKSSMLYWRHLPECSEDYDHANMKFAFKIYARLTAQ